MRLRMLKGQHPTRKGVKLLDLWRWEDSDGRFRIVPREHCRSRSDRPWMPRFHMPVSVHLVRNTPQVRELLDAIGHMPAPDVDPVRTAAQRDSELARLEEDERRRRSVQRLWEIAGLDMPDSDADTDTEYA